MEAFEIEEVLKTFRVVVDTREQATPRARARFKALGCPMERATLNFGDYCGNITLPSETALHDIAGRISAPCVIERKMNLDELAQCFTRDRARFKREFERAASGKAKVYLLVEDGSYEAIVGHRYRSRYNPAAFLASIIAWAARYDMTPIMCREATSGRLIREILYRDIKERLERGEYG